MKFLLLLVAVVLTCLAAEFACHAFNFDGSMPGDKAVVATAPDPRVRWQPYPVGGLALCDRDTCILLPKGAVLLIPFMVPDSVVTKETT